MKIYLLITSSLGIFTALFIFWLIRKDHLHIKFAFWWILVAILSAFIGVFPSIIDKLSSLIGVSYPPILAVTFAISFIFIKMLLTDIEQSKQQIRIIRLTQRLGLLELEKQKNDKQKIQ
jgi:drug/metabolite transporter (DMT)-like permease